MLEVLAPALFLRVRYEQGYARSHCQSRAGNLFHTQLSRLVPCSYNAARELSHKVPFDHLTDYWLCHELKLMCV